VVFGDSAPKDSFFRIGLKIRRSQSLKPDIRRTIVDSLTSEVEGQAVAMRLLAPEGATNIL
jgi:hypothetical protein